MEVETRGLGTQQVEKRLFAKYNGADYAILMDVRNAAGFSASRSADAIGIGLWPSRGCHITGFEIKVSRADWLKELKSPAKADAFFAYCDYWYLVVGSKEIVKQGELPEGWGLLVPHGDSLREAVAPRKNLDVVPMPRSMLAAWIKRATQQAPLAEVLQARYDEGVKHGKAMAEASPARATDDREFLRMKQQIEEFARSTGINILYGSYNADQLKKAIELVRNGDHSMTAARLRRMASEVRDIASSMDRASAKLLAPEVADGQVEEATR